MNCVLVYVLPVAPN